MKTTISDLYEKACGEWAGADWEHARRRDGRDTSDMCDHSGTCGVCADAARDASAAEQLAGEAMAALEAGRIDEAVRMAEQVRRIESAWGDSPTWGEWSRAVESVEDIRADAYSAGEDEADAYISDSVWGEHAEEPLPDTTPRWEGDEVDADALRGAAEELRAFADGDCMQGYRIWCDDKDVAPEVDDVAKAEYGRGLRDRLRAAAAEYDDAAESADDERSAS